jgi:hypothetical protein
MSEKNYTDEELDQFREIVEKLESPNQVVRIDGRMDLRPFLEKHGKEKCDEMFKVLEKEETR